MKTYYQSNINLNKDLRNIDYTPPTTLYVALSTTPISRDGSGIVEPNTSYGYARVPVATGTTTWSAPSQGVVYNNVDIQFPEATNSWGTIIYVAIFDALTGGNMRYFEALPSSKIVQENATVMFKAGALKFVVE